MAATHCELGRNLVQALRPGAEKVVVARTAPLVTTRTNWEVTQFAVQTRVGFFQQLGSRTFY